jgi:hypothetical protein
LRWAELRRRRREIGEGTVVTFREGRCSHHIADRGEVKKLKTGKKKGPPSLTV